MEFCDLCFQKVRPNLCETYKNTFTKINPIHFSQQTKLERILNKLQVVPKMVERRWSCTLEGSTRKEFLDSLWVIGISVHKLEDHAKVLTRLYKSEIRPLGDSYPLELSSTDLWEEFDPKMRSWNPLKVSKKHEKFTAKSSLVNILKCSSAEGTTYYRTNKSGDSVVLVPMERRAAYNMICTLAEPATAYWKSDTTGQSAVIDVQELNAVPDEIFSFLKRLGKKDKKSTTILVFDNEDVDLVRTVLSCVKINLVNSSDIVDITLSGNSGTKIMIGNIEKERLHVLSDVIRDMGGTIEVFEDRLIISGKRGSVKIAFTDDEKSMQDGNEIQISISALEVPSRFSEILSMIKKRLGLLDVSPDISLACHWPIVNDSDLQYVVQSAISWYGSNPLFACKIISENKKLPKIKEWNTKIKEGKIRSSLDTITLGKIIKRLEYN